MGEQLMRIQSELERCNKCGFCMAGCPTYTVSNLEWLVTRGRVALVQDAVRGELTWAEGLSDPVNTCLLCRACMDHCPPQIKIDWVMTRTKADHLESAGLPLAYRLLFRQLLPRPRLLRLAARVAALGERLGLRRLAARTGLLARWPALQRAHQAGPRLPGVTARELIAPWRSQPLAGRPRARVAYFIACTKDVIFPHAARATYQVLRANGVAVVLPDGYCCGLPPHSAGDLEGARRLARRNLDALERLDVDAIVADEASCTAHLSELAELFRGQPEEERARRLSARVVDLSVFLTRLGPVPMTHPVPARVTWHDPCHLKNYLKVSQEPRQLIRAVPGVTLAEAAGSDLCCGGAGTFMLTQPDLSDRLLAEKMDGFEATQAEYLVTQSPSCAIQLGRGTAQRGGRMRLLYLSELLAMGYGYPLR